MQITWRTDHLNLYNLNNISQGDRDIIEKYLMQFQDLIPKRIIGLKKSLKSEERKKIRQILHQMSPQLQFFGVPNIIQPIRRLEFEYETMPKEELEKLIKEILLKLELAVDEINLIILKHFTS